MGYFTNNEAILGIILSRGIKTSQFSIETQNICHQLGWHLIGDIYYHFDQFKQKATKKEAREVRNWFIDKHIKID